MMREREREREREKERKRERGNWRYDNLLVLGSNIFVQGQHYSIFKTTEVPHTGRSKESYSYPSRHQRPPPPGYETEQ